MDEQKMEQAHNDFVAKYDHKLFFDIFPMLIILLVLSAFGIFGNGQIVWGSLRKKSLRSNCNILISATAFSDILHQIGHFILGYHIFSAHTFISLYNCFLFQAIPVFWMNFGAFMMFSIGVDRLISVIAPLKYQSLNEKVYLTIMLLIPILFAFYMTFQTYKSVLVYENVRVICVLVETNHGEAKQIFLQIMLVLNFAIIVVYLAVWLAIKVKRGRTDKRVVRSLSAIVCLTLFGWFAASAIITIGIVRGWNEEQIFNAHMYIGSLVNVAISFQYPVYMYFSKDYRQAFCEQLQIMNCNFGKILPLDDQKTSRIESTTQQQQPTATATATN